MNVYLGPTINLPTQHGDFDVVHVTVHDASGSRTGIVREGVVLRGRAHAPPHIVRVQSSCLFSESFWATDCDCALQLRAALERVARDGGFVLYFYEEGRGAGLSAKFKAIELQQSRSMDTRAAYECLKISADSRSYEAAAEVIRHLVGGSAIVLLSNNPEKHDGLVRHGVNVVTRERLICGTESGAVRDYLREKAVILGHDIPDLPNGPSESRAQA
jgi:GTP cyclohydrolase II